MAKFNGKANMSNRIPPFNPREEAEAFINTGHFVFIYEAIHEYENGVLPFQG